MRKITNLKTYMTLTPSELADTCLSCPECGREHKIPIKIVQSGDNLIPLIPEIIQDILGKAPGQIGVIFDRHIEEKLDGLFFEPFRDLSLPFQRIPLGSCGQLLDASVDLGDETAERLPQNLDILLGVGSGVICDLTKWIATKSNLPFILIGTAASMNAYTSITGTMTEKNVKTTKWLKPASAVLLDSTLLASAPCDMTWSGIGDILARNVSNADWKLAQLLRDTYFCPVPFQMMGPFQEGFLSQIERLGQSDPNAMKALADAVLVSGYSMTILDGETSPSSGSEHVISHFFDFQHEIFDLAKNFHGTQVGIGTIIMSTAYDLLHEIDPSELDINEIQQRRPSQAEMQLEHSRIFGAYVNLFDRVVANKWISDANYRDYLQNIIQSWDRIWDELNPYLMPGNDVRRALEASGAVTKLEGVHRTNEDALQALLYGSHYRQRYTILDLFWELGLFPSYAQNILERSQVLN